MKIIYNKLIPFGKKFYAINLFGVLFAKGPCGEVVINHEQIHSAQIKELVNKCEREWTTQGGHNGYKVTGPNGNSIFLPAAGGYGNYWSATPYEGNTNYAYYLDFSSGYFDRYWGDRYRGLSVRPVSE